MEKIINFLQILNNDKYIIEYLHKTQNNVQIQQLIQDFDQNNLTWIPRFIELFPQIICSTPIPRNLYFIYLHFNWDRILPEDIPVLLSQYYKIKNLFLDPIFFAILFPKLPESERYISIELLKQAIQDIKCMKSTNFIQVYNILMFLKPFFSEIWEEIIQLMKQYLTEFLTITAPQVWENQKYYVVNLIEQFKLAPILIETLFNNYYTNKKINFDHFLQIISMIPGSETETLLTGLLITEENNSIRDKIRISLMKKEKSNEWNNNIYRSDSFQLLEQIS